MKYFLPAQSASSVLRLIFPAILAGSLLTGCGPQTATAPNAPNGTPFPQTQPSPQPGPAPAAAAQSAILGQWQATLQTGKITISFMSNGQYDQVGITNTGTQTMQAGPYQLVAPNNIIFTVTNWSPKTKIQLVPCGIPSDPVCNYKRIVTMPKPPGSEYAYTFNGPNAMTLNNATGPINFTRVMGQ